MILLEALDKFGYIGIELTTVGLLILAVYSVTPKDMPIDLKVSLGLIGSGLVSLVLYCLTLL